MAKYVMGYWDCTSCGASVKGTEKFCKECGQPKGADVKYYMKEMNYLSDEEAKNLNTNPDWLCPYCGSYNPDNETVCTSCGAGRSTESSDYFDLNKDKERLRDKDTSRWECASCKTLNEETNLVCKQCGAPKENRQNQPSASQVEVGQSAAGNARLAGKKKKNLIAGVISGGVLLIALMVLILIPKTKDVTVESFRWVTNTTLEELLTYKESDWSVPGGGRIYDEREEYYGDEPIYETRTREVTTEEIVGYDTSTEYRDTGSGVFESVEVSTPVYGPVTRTETYQEIVGYNKIYKTKYYYEIDRWTEQKRFTEQGSDQSPFYTEVETGEKERVIRDEDYFVTVSIKKDKQKEYEIEYDLWIQMKQGEKYTVKIAGGNEIIEIVEE